MKRPQDISASSILLKFALLGVFTIPLLLWTDESFAFLSAPLSPFYWACSIAENPSKPGCTGSMTVTRSPVQNSFPQLIGYVYSTQVTGTVPVYWACSIAENPFKPGCTASMVFTVSPVQNSFPQLIGYVYSTQVTGTVPVYWACSIAENPFKPGCTASMIVTRSPVTNSFPRLIGYIYPSIPAPTSFVVYPKYFIGSVIYVPPGQGQSSVTYGAGSVTGTTVSTTNSWTNNSSAGVSYGDVSVTFGNNFGGSTTTSVDMQSTTNQSTTYKGPGSNYVNHDYDQLQLFLGVNVIASIDYLGNITWSVDFSKIASQGFAETGYPISVGCLRTNSTIPPAQCTATISLLNSVGITSTEYPKMLGADPFADPNASQTPNHNRYVLIDAVNYLPNPTTSTLTYNENNSTTASNSVTSNYTYSVGAGFSASYDGISLKTSSTFTWTNSSTHSNKTGSSSSSAFTLSLPSAPYSGPTTLFVYLDTIYKTFMFSFYQ